MQNSFNLNTSTQNGTGVQIKRLLLVPTREAYKDIYQRSFKLSAKFQDIQKLEAVFDQARVGANGRVSEALIATTMPEIINLDPMTTGKVEVPNGWGTQRLRFMMEVETIMNGNIMVSYLQGYSDYHDPSLSGHVDPRMTMFINSVTNVLKMIDPTGGMVIRPHNTYNVITDLAGGSKYEAIDNYIDNTNSLALIRPTDIFEDIQVGGMYGDGATTVTNTMGTVGAKPNTSKRSNNDSVKYFTSTLNSFIDGKNISDVSYDTTDALRNASANTAEENIMANPFVYALHALTGEISPTTFTPEMLERIDGNTPNVTIMASNNTNMGILDHSTHLDTNDTADMLNPTVENMLANTVAQSISSVMVDNMITKLAISFTNGSGQPVTVISNANSFIEGIDMTAYLNKIVSKVDLVLMPELTYNNQQLVEVYVDADLLGDTTISISINNNPHLIFRFPTFADSLYSPVITDKAHRAETVTDYQNVFDSVMVAGQN